MNKFASRKEYQEWCESMVNKIYYANIASNNEKIKDVVQEISRKMWVAEGEELWPSDSNNNREPGW